jgi:four helix bundle protein
MEKETQYTYGFEKLNIWKDSILFAKDIYKITETFPNTEKFGLVSQMRRAVVSIPSNIAEGSAKQSLKDQARFTEISKGSLFEVLNQVIIAYELKFINEEDYLKIREKIDSLNKKLKAFENSQIKRYKKQ